MFLQCMSEKINVAGEPQKLNAQMFAYNGEFVRLIIVDCHNPQKYFNTKISHMKKSTQKCPQIYLSNFKQFWETWNRIILHSTLRLVRMTGAHRRSSISRPAFLSLKALPALYAWPHGNINHFIHCTTSEQHQTHGISRYACQALSPWPTGISLQKYTHTLQWSEVVCDDDWGHSLSVQWSQQFQGYRGFRPDPWKEAVTKNGHIATPGRKLYHVCPHLRHL